LFNGVTFAIFNFLKTFLLAHDRVIKNLGKVSKGLLSRAYFDKFTCESVLIVRHYLVIKLDFLLLLSNQQLSLEVIDLLLEIKLNFLDKFSELSRISIDLIFKFHLLLHFLLWIVRLADLNFLLRKANLPHLIDDLSA